MNWNKLDCNEVKNSRESHNQLSPIEKEKKGRSHTGIL